MSHQFYLDNLKYFVKNCFTKSFEDSFWLCRQVKRITQSAEEIDTNRIILDLEVRGHN